MIECAHRESQEGIANMKKTMKVLSVAVAAMFASTVWAKAYIQSSSTNGRQWWYYLDSSGNAIIEHENSESTATAAISTTATGDINIPSSLDGHSVVGIGNKAFYYGTSKIFVETGSITLLLSYCRSNPHEVWAQVQFPAEEKDDRTEVLEVPISPCRRL